MKPQREEEEEINITWQYVLTIVCHWRRKEGDLTKIHPTQMYMM